MADTRDIDLEALLKRVEFLEKENHSLRAEVEELKTNDIEIKAELNTINRFISAMTESQSIDEIMTEIESAAKQLTDSDNVIFYCMDSVNEKFFAEDEGRNWQSKAETEFLKNVSDNQEIQNDGTRAYIPLISGNGNTLGVIAAERSGGFNTDDLARNFSKGGTFVENIKLGLEKEYQHQGRITDELMEAYMQAEIADLRSQLEEARGKDGSKSFSVKEIEKTIARYEKKLKEGQDKVSKDDYIDFEEMGFDKLFVDECHLYKNLGTATKMSNVAGIGTTGSGKAAELLMKTRYFDELTGGKGMVFASGTPIITGYLRSKMPILRCLKQMSITDESDAHFLFCCPAYSISFL